MPSAALIRYTGLQRISRCRHQLHWKDCHNPLWRYFPRFEGTSTFQPSSSELTPQQILGAQELGAAGVLVYSDPRDDGDVAVEKGYAPWPAGPARNPTSVQRGSVQYISLYPGDPTTPGYPAYKDAKRTEGENIPKIPSLPISWKNAERLLEEIGGLYVNGTFSKDVHLNGKSSNTSVKLVNHGMFRETPLPDAFN